MLCLEVIVKRADHITCGCWAPLEEDECIVLHHAPVVADDVACSRAPLGWWSGCCQQWIWCHRDHGPWQMGPTTGTVCCNEQCCAVAQGLQLMPGV
jgi:hypothetical protein